MLACVQKCGKVEIGVGDYAFVSWKLLFMSYDVHVTHYYMYGQLKAIQTIGIEVH